MNSSSRAGLAGSGCFVLLWAFGLFLGKGWDGSKLNDTKNFQKCCSTCERQVWMQESRVVWIMNAITQVSGGWPQALLLQRGLVWVEMETATALARQMNAFPGECDLLLSFLCILLTLNLASLENEAGHPQHFLKIIFLWEGYLL